MCVAGNEKVEGRDDVKAGEQERADVGERKSRLDDDASEGWSYIRGEPFDEEQEPRRGVAYLAPHEDVHYTPPTGA